MDEARFMRIQRNENSFLWDRSQTLEDIEYARVKEGLLLEEIALEEVRCEKTIEILEDFMCKDVAQMVMDYTK